MYFLYLYILYFFRCTSFSAGADDFDDLIQDEVNIPDFVERFYNAVNSIEEKDKIAYVLYSYYLCCIFFHAL